VPPDEVDPDLRFGAIYTNPPIRVGRQQLLELLTTWLGRLEPGGHAYLWCSATSARIRSLGDCGARVSTSSGWGPSAATDSWTCATPVRRRIMADHARDHHHRHRPDRLLDRSLAVHWYGIMYVVAFVAAYYLGARPHAVSRGISQEYLERLTGWASSSA